MTENAVVRKTFLYDSLQVFVRGIIDTGPRTFFLLIAVRHFEASELIKSLLAAPTFMGMLLSLFAWKFFSQSRLSLPALSSLLRVIVGCGFLVSALHDNPVYYAITVVVTCMFLPINFTLQTSIYKENYPPQMRGKLYGWSMVLNLLGSILFHWLIGFYLEGDISRYRHVLVVYGIAALVTAGLISRIPRPKVKVPERNQSLVGSLKLIYKDKLFGYMLLIWYTFGFANLLTFPIRIIYLSDPSFGLNLSAATIAILVGVIPDALRIVFTPFWAWVFDRVNFIKLRIVLNIILWLSIFSFFLSHSLWVIALGSILFGIFFAGGSVAWMLWITHYAPPGKTGQYMSVHVFLTGTRGVLGAFLGIYLVERVGLTPVWITSLVLCGLSVLMLVPVIRQGNFRDRNREVPPAE